MLDPEQHRQGEKSSSLSIIGLIRLRDNIDVNRRITQATCSGIDMSFCISWYLLSWQLVSYSNLLELSLVVMSCKFLFKFDIKRLCNAVEFLKYRHVFITEAPSTRIRLRFVNASNVFRPH